MTKIYRWDASTNIIAIAFSTSFDDTRVDTVRTIIHTLNNSSSRYDGQAYLYSANLGKQYDGTFAIVVRVRSTVLMKYPEILAQVAVHIEELLTVLDINYGQEE